MKHVTVYSDGSCQNPRRKGGEKNPGGCAAIIVWDDHDEVVRLACGEMRTFVNRMELLGAITGLRYLNWLWTSKSPDEREAFMPENLEVEMITDSAYLFRAAIGLSKREANPDLWKIFSQLGAKFGKITVEHRPRNTHRWMEEADRIAGIVRRRILDGDEEIAACAASSTYFEIPE